MDDGLRAAIKSVQQLALDPACCRGAPFAAAETARLVIRQRPVHHPEWEILALWLADAVLAIRLKWPLPLPLVAGAILHPSLRISSDEGAPKKPEPLIASLPICRRHCAGGSS